MKTRSGFISNSSSSSFILGFLDPPTDEHAVRLQLFGKHGIHYHYDYQSWDEEDKAITTTYLCSLLSHNLNLLEEDDLVEAFRDEGIVGSLDPIEDEEVLTMSGKEVHEYYDRLEKETHRRRDLLREFMVAAHPDRQWYYVELDDKGGREWEVKKMLKESRIPHVVISNH